MPFREVTPEGFEVKELLYNLPDNFRNEFPKQETFKLFPHVFEKVNGLWGNTECHDYLNELVVNRFDRNRKGFPQGVLDELLWLGIHHPYIPPLTDPWAMNSGKIR